MRFDRFTLHPAADVYNQPFSTKVNRRDDEMLPAPHRVCPAGHFLPGAAPMRAVTARIVLKINLPTPSAFHLSAQFFSIVAQRDFSVNRRFFARCRSYLAACPNRLFPRSRRRRCGLAARCGRERGESNLEKQECLEATVCREIGARTGGEILIGVVGPVRTGKSTLIKQFMEQLVLPAIGPADAKLRARDELPQSAAGRTIMTTEPKFIPEQAVPLQLEGGGECRIRLIDCVGYMVEGAMGHEEDEKPRMVKSPWFEEEIPFDDPEIFKLMGSGHTAGVFQVESAGMTATIKNMKPTEYKHVVALIALYRPGPLGAGMVSSYINRMNGKEPAVSYDDRLDDILGETYGTMVYQEQVMLISVEMCGFSKGESDSRIRKPVAKKKIKLLTSTVLHWEDGSDETTYDHWMNGAIKNNYTREVAQKIWDDVLEFASYAFNKSHSAGYAILVMQTAWLKAHYPHEYMAAVLTSYTGKTDKIVHYVSACRHDGIPVLSPDVNESGTEFTATKEGVRFGLAGIRGVGTGVAQAIIAEREAGGPFKTLHDFVERVDSSQANRRVIESLIKAGAFDSTGYPRRQMMHFVDKNNPENIIDAAVKRQKDRASGQTSFFDMFGDVEGSGFEVSVPDPDGQEWDRHLKLSQEKEVLGIYVSDHPLRPFEYALAKARDFSFSQIDTGYEVQNPTGGTINQEIPEGKALWWAGMVSSVSKRVTKNGDPMGIVQLEDMEGEATVVVFPKTYKEAEGYLYGEVDPETGAQLSDAFVRIKGKLERSDRGDQIIAQEIVPLELNEENNKPKVFEVMVPNSRFSQGNMARLATVLTANPGGDRVEIFIEQVDGRVLRAEVPAKVNARSIPLLAEAKAIVGNQGRVTVI